MLRKTWNFLLLQTIRTTLNSLSYLAPKTAGRWAFILFCTPRAGRPEDMDTRILETAERQTVSLAGQTTQLYHWPGTGKRIFLLHGWESNSARWESFLPLLQEQDFDIWALDAPGHGYSTGKRFTVPLYAQAVKEALDMYPPEALVGHSAGGMASVLYLSKYQPKFVKELVLLATPSELIELVDLYRKALGLSERLINQMGQVFEKRFAYPIQSFSIQRMAGKLDLPGLIIHDLQDDIAPFQDARAIHKNWPQAKLITTEGFGHSLFAPDVIEEVARYLSQTPAVSKGS